MIEIRNVSKSYKSTKQTVHALIDVSLSIPKGAIFGMIGQSGAGKSTLIRCLARLVKPDSGQILLDDENIGNLEGANLRQFRRKIGMIFQHFNLFQSRTVAANIVYPLEIAHVPKEEQEKRVDELLGLIGLQDKKHAYPSQLSGGEKQRVGIARALANHPEVLLCDEATSALDPKTTKEILDLLKTINQKLGLTIFLITHEMEVIKRICHQVAVIEKGRLVEHGLVSEVFADPQHPTTKLFLETSSHEIPPEFFKESSPNRKLLRLCFKGKAAGEPIISQIVKKFDVEANILLGWIDNLQNVIVGTLVIELLGSPEGIQRTLKYLSDQQVQWEEMKNES